MAHKIDLQQVQVSSGAAPFESVRYRLLRPEDKYSLFHYLHYPGILLII
jgi:hypothetical protein